MRLACNLLEWIVAGLMLLLLSGCHTHVSGLKTSPSFTYQAAVSGHIAIVGVVSASAPLAAGDMATYANQIHTQLNDARPDYVLIPYGEVINQLGQENHAKLLADIQTMGYPSTSSLDALKASARNYRYILFSRLESDVIQRFTMHEDPPLKGERPITSRQVMVSLQVMDITEGQTVWSANGSTLLQNTSGLVTAPPPKNHHGSVAAELLDIIFDKPPSKPEDYHYAPEPSLTSVLHDSFGGLAKHLPKK